MHGSPLVPSIRSFAIAALGAILLVLGTGCGAVAAAANPKVAWAVNDPAPMSVVVRRADAAEKTSQEVDRLLTATPANLDSEWIQQVGPSPDTAAAEIKTVSQLPFYVESKARVVPSEVWVRTLPGVKGGKGGKPQFQSLLAAIDKDLADRYGKIVQKRQELVGIQSLIATEQAAIDDKDATPADKSDHQKKKEELEKMADATQKELSPLQADFAHGAKEAAGKAAPEAREKIGVALVNLRQAIDDAQIANGAAAVRYPLAAPTVLSSLKAVVPVLVADIVEEQTGKRPNLNKLSPDVKLEGTSVSLTLNGLEPGDIGKIKLADLVTESVKRSTAWVTHTASLLGAIASTKEALSFQADMLDAMVEGFTAGGWKVIVAAKIPGQDEGGSGVASLLGGGDGGGKGGKGVAGKVDTASLTSGAGLKAAAKGAATDATKTATKEATKEGVKATTKAATAAADKATAKVGGDVTRTANKVAADPATKSANKAVTKAGNGASRAVSKGVSDTFSP